MTTFNDTYEIQSIIGQGGMSTVYLAEHKRLHTRWAVKQVRKAQGAKFDFLAESNLLKKLQHPMLPRIVDIFEDQDSIYIVEDFVEGITLEDWLKANGRVDENRGMAWFTALCGVLHYLHSQKPHPIIYRDMKPSNVMLQGNGSLKLIDFGIAREYKQESSADTTYIGTKGYAAPEQFGTAQTDERTDIYALGVTMYHLLTGKSPYQPPYQFVPARQLVPTLSAGTEYILNKCIQPEPGDRYQNTDELMEDLTHRYRFDQAYHRYLRAKRGRRLLLAGMLALSIVLMASGLVVHRQEQIAAEEAVKARYEELLDSLDSYYAGGDFDGAMAVIQQARELQPNRVESYTQEAYVLYLTGEYQACVDYIQELREERYLSNSNMRLIQASAYFELGEYDSAAEIFQEEDWNLSADNRRDYAVCLGRMGRTAEAKAILEELQEEGASTALTAYLSGQLAYAEGDYSTAQNEFQFVLEVEEDPALLRRCYMALAELYRDTMDYDAEIAVIQQALSQPELGTMQNSVYYEMLGAAYYSRGTSGGDAQADLPLAAENFASAIRLGAQKEYLYVNIFTSWVQLEDYDKALEILEEMEQVYPTLYTPHALRATVYILQENQKDQSQRDYTEAYQEYETARSLVTAEDETSYLQQLEGFIDQLRSGGWLG